MKRSCIIFVCFSFLLISHCTSIMKRGLIVSCTGRILDEENNGIDSAQIEIIDMKAVGHQSPDSYLGKFCYSDENGNYLVYLPSGVEWEQNDITGEKKYTKYVENITIKVLKTTFKDTVITLYNTDYGTDFPETDIVLKRQFNCIQ